MAKVFITGSADGLGLIAAQILVEQGHKVVLHARNAQRGKEALRQIPAAEKVLIADLSSIEETKKLAEDVNTLGRFDAIIHNAGVYTVSKKQIFAVNVLAPYILSSMIQKPKRLIYIGSGMHLQGNISIEHLSSDLQECTYSDSKLYLLMLSMALARQWPDVYVNTVDPGWVPTKMGGSDAPDDLLKGAETQVWLAVSQEAQAKVSGSYLFHQKAAPYLPEAADRAKQERLIELCAVISGIRLPIE